MPPTTESPIELPPYLRRVEHLALRQVGEELIVLDLRRSRVYGFNPAAGELLELLREGGETETLVARAGTDAGEVAGLREFLALLVGHGLVAAAEPADRGPGTARPSGASSGVPRLLWSEEVARVTHQTSPPQAITNPQCQP